MKTRKRIYSSPGIYSKGKITNEESNSQLDKAKTIFEKKKSLLSKAKDKKQNPKVKLIADCNSPKKAKSKKLKSAMELRKQTVSLTSKAKGKTFKAKAIVDTTEKSDIEDDVNVPEESDINITAENEEVELQHECKKKPNSKATVIKEKGNNKLKAKIVTKKKNSLNAAKNNKLKATVELRKQTRSLRSKAEGTSKSVSMEVAENEDVETQHKRKKKPNSMATVIKEKSNNKLKAKIVTEKKNSLNEAKNNKLKATVELRKQTRSLRSKAEGRKLTVEYNKEIKENEEITEKEDVNMLVKSDNIAKSVNEITENEDVETQHECKKKQNKTTVINEKSNSKLTKAKIVAENKNLLNGAKNKMLKASVELRKQTHSLSSKSEGKKLTVNDHSLSSKSEGKKLTVNDNEEIMEKYNVDMMEESDVSVEVPKKERNYLEIAENGDMEQYEQEDITANMDVEEITETKDVEEDEQEELAKNEDVEEQYEWEEIAENVDMGGEHEITENKDAEAHEQTSDGENRKDIESEDECPDEVAFSNSRNDAMESLKLVREEINKMKSDRKEIRKKIHERNVLQKKRKEDKIVEIQKRKLPQHLLEYVSKLPKTVKLDEKREQKPKTTELMDDLIDEKSEELYMPKDEDFISLHGSTEFRACPLDKIVKRPTSIAASAAEFRQRAFFGNKIKRESVAEMKSKIIKQAVAGKL